MLLLPLYSGELMYIVLLLTLDLRQTLECKFAI